MKSNTKSAINRINAKITMVKECNGEKVCGFPEAKLANLFVCIKFYGWILNV